MDQPFQVHKDTLKASLTYAARRNDLIQDAFVRFQLLNYLRYVQPNERIQKAFDTIKIAKVLGGVAASLNAPCHRMQLMKIHRWV